jgi:hypothetical protein
MFKLELALNSGTGGIIESVLNFALEEREYGSLCHSVIVHFLLILAMR